MDNATNTYYNNSFAKKIYLASNDIDRINIQYLANNIQ